MPAIPPDPCDLHRASSQLLATAARLMLVFAALVLTAGCAGRLEGRQLRWHDTRAVKRPPERQEGGRKAHSPSRRASDSRPRGKETEQGVFEGERMDIDRYRVYVQTENDERRQRYGPRRAKGSKKSPTQAPKPPQKTPPAK
jgi:hypothetical protein